MAVAHLSQEHSHGSQEFDGVQISAVNIDHSEFTATWSRREAPRHGWSSYASETEGIGRRKTRKFVVSPALSKAGSRSGRRSRGGALGLAEHFSEDPIGVAGEISVAPSSRKKGARVLELFKRFSKAASFKVDPNHDLTLPDHDLTLFGPRSRLSKTSAAAVRPQCGSPHAVLIVVFCAVIQQFRHLSPRYHASHVYAAGLHLFPLLLLLATWELGSAVVFGLSFEAIATSGHFAVPLEF
ncbi:hypothetical protein C8R45DRAFT_925602 [Mycena sanguinolenta]|nr:hypothetical protein C8R45DRAFT_925602 [Mycena sanguinolenta]